MKSVLISIQPKWVEKIVKGEKTIEVRKSCPKIDTPFKCYIYCTKGENLWLTQNGVKSKTELAGYLLNGKVIGDFVCDRVYDIKPHCDIGDYVNQYECGWKYGEDFHCLSFSEMKSYLKNKKGYGWHISDLVIYDEPKEVNEFKKHYECGNNSCGNCTKCDKDYHLTRLPQSWCYIEEQDND